MLVVVSSRGRIADVEDFHVLPRLANEQQATMFYVANAVRVVVKVAYERALQLKVLVECNRTIGCQFTHYLDCEWISAFKFGIRLKQDVILANNRTFLVGSSLHIIWTERGAV